MITEESVRPLSEQLEYWRYAADTPLWTEEFGVWLEGIGIALPPSAEPYQVIAQAVIETGTFSVVTQALSAILRAWLIGEWEPLIADRAQYNLLHLCAEIRDGDSVVADLVWQIFDRHLVAGDYRGSDLKAALLLAMIYNQPDLPRVEDFWRKMLDGNPDPYIGGKVVDGFRGLIRLRFLTMISPTARESYLGKAFAELWRTAVRIQRTDLAWRELRRLLETHPALRLNDVLAFADVPEAARALGILDLDVARWLDSRKYDSESADVWRMIWRAIFDTAAPDSLVPGRTEKQILEKVRVEVRRKMVSHGAFPFLTFVINRSHAGERIAALPKEGLTVAMAEKTYAGCN